MRPKIHGLLRRIPLASAVRRAVDWRSRERIFRHFLLKGPALLPPTGEPIVVLVQPWLLSDVPWYSLLLALGIRQRGRRVVIVWDDIPWDIGLTADRMVNASIARALAILGPSWEVRRLSAHATVGT